MSRGTSSGLRRRSLPMRSRRGGSFGVGSVGLLGGGTIGGGRIKVSPLLSILDGS